jgi:hypothetical protein
LPDSDDHIKLGKGGAVPQNLMRSKDACVLIGLPASGKSTIARRFATEYGAIILDSDFAKRKLPEFPNYPWGASIVHEESAKIIFGEEEDGFASLFAKASNKTLISLFLKLELTSQISLSSLNCLKVWITRFISHWCICQKKRQQFVL